MRIVLLAVELRYEISVYLRRYGLLTASVKTMLYPRRETAINRNSVRLSAIALHTDCDLMTITQSVTAAGAAPYKPNVNSNFVSVLGNRRSRNTVCYLLSV